MDEVVEWDEIEPLAQATFNIFTGQPELNWARQAWAVLERDGLTTGGSCLYRAQAYVRMLVLASMYRDWCATVWDEVQDDEVEYWIHEFDFLPLGVGQLLGPDEELSDDDPESALVEALGMLMGRERNAVVSAIVQGFGGVNDLFVALWRSNKEPYEPSNHDGEEIDDGSSAEQRDLFDDGDDGESEADEDYAQILNDFTPEKMAGYEWISQGCENLGPVRCHPDFD